MIDTDYFYFSFLFLGYDHTNVYVFDNDNNFCFCFDNTYMFEYLVEVGMIITQILIVTYITRYLLSAISDLKFNLFII